MTRRRLVSRSPFLVLAVFALLVAGCGGGGDDEAEPTDAPAGDEPSATATAGAGDSSAQVRYLAIGDSLSQGIGGDDFETAAFPARLAERWREAGCTVDLNNAGVSGYTASQMIEEQVPKIEEFSPNLITFQTGANDIANGVTEAEYRKNIGVILDAAVASGARVYVLLQNEWFRAPEGPNYGGTRALRDAYDTIMLAETKARNVTVVDLRPIYKQQADRNEWVDDGIHPTDKAYDAWSEALAKMIPRPCPLLSRSRD